MRLFLAHGAQRSFQKGRVTFCANLHETLCKDRNVRNPSTLGSSSLMEPSPLRRNSRSRARSASTSSTSSNMSARKMTQSKTRAFVRLTYRASALIVPGCKSGDAGEGDRRAGRRRGVRFRVGFARRRSRLRSRGGSTRRRTRPRPSKDRARRESRGRPCSRGWQEA